LLASGKKAVFRRDKHETTSDNAVAKGEKDEVRSDKGLRKQNVVEQ